VCCIGVAVALQWCCSVLQRCYSVLQFVVRMTEEYGLSEVQCVALVLQWRCSGVATYCRSVAVCCSLSFV